MRKVLTWMIGLTACLFLFSACTLPRGAALKTEILSKSDINDAQMAVYPIDRSFLPIVEAWPHTGARQSDGWIARQRGPSSRVIVSGDRLNLSIWDSDENSLLTAPGQKTVEMEEVLVSSDGTIFVPYLDRIYISGMTPDAARETIQTQLEAIIASAQVQLSLASGRRNSVDLVGGVAKAGNYPLPDRNFTVLNLISQGGGVQRGLKNPQVRLMRRGKLYITSVATLYEDPSQDTTLRGGDKIIIEEDKRYFLSLGAAGRESLFHFEKDDISALDAMSMIGGISDYRADPQGILILREYADTAVRDDATGPSKSRVVFSIDLTSADGLFSAGRFMINPNDVVLVTESPAAAMQTVFGLLGRAFGVANQL